MKTPVQQWSTADVDASYTEKNKHVYVEILGPNPINLHFSAGGKDYAEAIIEKLDFSKAAAKAAIASASSAVEEPQGNGVSTPPTVGGSPRPKKNGVSVHFATTPPAIISPHDHEAESEPEDYISARDERVKQLGDGKEWVTVLYDFTADGDDELSVAEGDRLVVLERDSDDWWKVKDSMGHEGVVPAQYIELETKVSICVLTS
jgi:actin cytoskeleton-regulatory complex protein SLA1